MRIGILGSTRGSNLEAIVSAIANHELSANIAVVISNKPDAGILSRAQSHHLPAIFIDPTGLSREAYDATLSKTLRDHQVDVIVLIGYMRILSDSFVTQWENKIMNVHPSLLPAFAGLMDLDVHRAVIASAAKETGCTVHTVTKELDAGPILLQKRCPVYANDTPELLKSRVQALEGQALVEVLRNFS